MAACLPEFDGLEVKKLFQILYEYRKVFLIITSPDCDQMGAGKSVVKTIKRKCSKI